MRRRLPVDELLELEFDSVVVKFMKHSTKQLRINGNRGISGTLRSPFY
jgi:hypothetical protein